MLAHELSACIVVYVKASGDGCDRELKGRRVAVHLAPGLTLKLQRGRF